MMKRLDWKTGKKNKNGQKGFTLVEILVAITILAILTLPILSAFSSSAKLNHTARVQENCNTIGQLFSERCKSISLEDMIAALDSTDPDENKKYGFSSYVRSLSESEPADSDQFIYTMTSMALDANGNEYIDGSSEGDRYYVQVELSPEAYTYPDSTVVPSDKEKYINSYELPQFADVMDSSNFVIRKQIYQYDNSVQSLLSGSNKKSVYRSVEVNVSVTDKDDSGALNTVVDADHNTHIVYTQKVTMTVTYHSISDTTQVSTPISYDLGSTEIYGNDADSSYKNVYVFYDPCDIYRTDSALDQSLDEVTFNFDVSTENGKLNTDKDINHNDMTDKQMNVYLVEQDTSNANDSDTLVHLQKDNVKVKTTVNGTSSESSFGSGIAVNTLGLGINNLVNLYTNVSELANTDENNQLTQQTQSVASTTGTNVKYLYNMTIKIWLNEDPSTPADPDDPSTIHSAPYMTLTSTKENMYD